MKKLFVALLVLLSFFAVSCDDSIMIEGENNKAETDLMEEKEAQEYAFSLISPLVTGNGYNDDLGELLEWGIKPENNGKSKKNEDGTISLSSSNGNLYVSFQNYETQSKRYTGKYEVNLAEQKTTGDLIVVDTITNKKDEISFKPDSDNPVAMIFILNGRTLSPYTIDKIVKPSS